MHSSVALQTVANEAGRHETENIRKCLAINRGTVNCAGGLFVILAGIIDQRARVILTVENQRTCNVNVLNRRFRCAVRLIFICAARHFGVIENNFMIRHSRQRMK